MVELNNSYTNFEDQNDPNFLTGIDMGSEIVLTGGNIINTY